MVQLDHLQVRCLGHEGGAEEFAPVRSYLTVEKLQNGAIVEPFDVLSDKPCALVLALSFPEPNARTVFVADLQESIDDGLRPLPSQLIVMVNPTDRNTLLHIFFVRLLENATDRYFQSRAIFPILFPKAITTDIFFFSLFDGRSFLRWHNFFFLI